MAGAKMGLIDYISRNPFARAKKISTYDEHFVVATISKIRNSMKHLIKNKQNTLQKFKSILKLHSPLFHSKQSFAQQMHTPVSTNSQISTKPLAPQLLLSEKKVPFASQLTLSNSIVNPHLNHPFASQIPLKVRKSQFVPNNCKVNNSHSINEFAAKDVQMSDSKECEHSEQLYPIKPINGIKSNNSPKITKLSAKTQIPKYKYHLHKNHPLFAQNRSTTHLTLNNSIKPLHTNNSVNHINKMPKTKATRSKSTPTKARVTFSDTTPSTPGKHTSFNTETPSSSLIEEADDIYFTETLNKIFNRNILAILTGKDAILKEVRDCVMRDHPNRLREISLYLFSYWRDLSMKHGCVCLDERIAIPKALKDAVLEDIHSTHPGSFAMLSLTQNI